MSHKEKNQERKLQIKTRYFRNIHLENKSSNIRIRKKILTELVKPPNYKSYIVLKIINRKYHKTFKKNSDQAMKRCNKKLYTEATKLHSWHRSKNKQPNQPFQKEISKYYRTNQYFA